MVKLLIIAVLVIFAVNGYQALAGYNMPGSALVAAFDFVVLCALVWAMKRGRRQA